MIPISFDFSNSQIIIVKRSRSQALVLAGLLLLIALLIGAAVAILYVEDGNVLFDHSPLIFIFGLAYLILKLLPIIAEMITHLVSWQFIVDGQAKKITRKLNPDIPFDQIDHIAVRNVQLAVGDTNLLVLGLVDGPRIILGQCRNQEEAQPSAEQLAALIGTKVVGHS